MTEIYGVVMDNRPERDMSPPTFYVVPFQVVDVRKNQTARPAGICFVTVVFRPTVPVPALDISPAQELSWGGDASVDASLADMLPFQTGPYHGFRDTLTDRLIGHGKFFATLAEAKVDTASIYPGSSINLVPITRESPHIGVWARDGLQLLNAIRSVSVLPGAQLIAASSSQETGSRGDIKRQHCKRPSLWIAAMSSLEISVSVLGSLAAIG